MRLRRGGPALASLILSVVVTSLATAGAVGARPVPIFSSAHRLTVDELACSPDSPRAEALQIWTLPEAGSKPFVAAIDGANDSIRVMIYELGEGPILDALERKARSGVPVRVILDGARAEVNQRFRERLLAAGARVHWSSPEFAFTHAKTMILDQAVALISTGNFGEESLATERNYVARDADPDDVAVLVRLFDADWRSKRPDLRCTRLLIAPVNARQRLIDLIDSASATLDIESMTLSDDEVRAAVVARAASGASVRVLLGAPDWVESSEESAAGLLAHGIPVRFLRSPNVHVKSIVVDGLRVFLGSENLTYNSLANNREIGLITDEQAVVESMSTTFATDWKRGIPF
jgi:phosphatidylserine/phosphatidylglycerophosphate/cardiolipin synthase-like enzyme